jgi:hypothetical protein
MTTAIAKQIGNSQNETITVNGEVFIKAAPLNKWQYIVEVTSGDQTFTGKSGSLNAANKWVPFPMCDDFVDPRVIKRTHPDHVESINRAEAAIKAGGGTWKRDRRRGIRFYRVPRPFTRKVTKIER